MVEHYEIGYPVGFIGNKEVGNEGEKYIYNHLKIVVYIHPSDTNVYRVVGFEVEPHSIHHVYTLWQDKITKLTTCQHPRTGKLQSISKPENDEVVYTYDVFWVDSPLQWASRWDVYLKMRDSQIHWFSIINSIMIVIFLSGMVAMIMMRTLHRDFARYNEIDQSEEAQMEETGWKLVHGDVFRPPKYAGLLASFAGTGAQVFAMAFATIFFAALGFLTPANRGSIMTGMILLYVFMGIFAGFVGTRLFSMFGLVQWRKNTLLTALLFPGFNFSVFFILNLVVWAKGSSGAVPFFEMFSILVLWFGISVPLVYLGSYLGQQRPPITPPVRVNQIPRQIPAQAWYMKPLFSVLVGGVLPFGAVFIEVFFIMSSIWLHRFYYVFGFLLLVFLILIVTCAEITIVMCYFQLCSEDYNWWWRSFFTSGSSALYMFLYSILYFTTKLDITRFASAMLFFGYMILICFFFFVLTGTIGFVSTLLFVRKIYGSIKVD
eukprot:TRINITY_DN3905_c0_g1_i3.p1 TRINITY_DN3905_c0_g1~~TRINITY_DN3905_c0_g1_i3.p1  ORF type:complete len:489 (+),score=128.74 TRINITY_DN3905_c0_g1_i3:532-1998(+)